MTTSGETAVILRRLDALKRAIEERDWAGTEFSYDQTRSAVERLLGTRDRPSDALRRSE